MAHPDVVLRRADSADIGILLPLCAEHAAFERLACPADQRVDALVAALDARPPRLHAWLAFAGNEAVGYASATLDFSTLDRATFLHMDCLYVRNDWRNRAIGRQLWQLLHDFARAHGCHTVQWQTPEWNTAAARFYRRLGAREQIKRRYTLALDGQDGPADAERIAD